MVCPMPPYRRICLQRSHPSRQSCDDVVGEDRAELFDRERDSRVRRPSAARSARACRRHGDARLLGDEGRRLADERRIGQPLRRDEHLRERVASRPAFRKYAPCAWNCRAAPPRRSAASTTTEFGDEQSTPLSNVLPVMMSRAAFPSRPIARCSRARCPGRRHRPACRRCTPRARVPCRRSRESPRRRAASSAPACLRASRSSSSRCCRRARRRARAASAMISATRVMQRAADGCGLMTMAQRALIAIRIL